MKNKKSFLLLILAILFFSTYAKTTKVVHASEIRQLAMIFASGNVLGDSDDQDKEEEQDQDKEQEQEQEEEKKQEDGKEAEQEQEHEQEQEQEKVEVHTEEQIKNSNGSTTYIKREQQDGKSEVELKTYNSAGRLIEERKLKQEKDDKKEAKELELESYVHSNGDLKELKVKSKEGKELEISVKESTDSTALSKVRYELNEQQLRITDQEHKGELLISPSDDHFELRDRVSKASVHLPITVDPDSGDVFVETLIGLVKVGISPDRALEIINGTEENLDSAGDNITLEESDTGLEYRINAQKKELLVGLFPVSLDSEYTIDAETGSYTGVNQTVWTKLLDLLSF